jgi:hypothetical protein
MLLDKSAGVLHFLTDARSPQRYNQEPAANTPDPQPACLKHSGEEFVPQSLSQSLSSAMVLTAYSPL